MKRWIVRTVFALVVLGLVGGAAAWYLRQRTAKDPTFRVATVKRGDLLATIGATGTVEPEEVVDVGAQVAGQILPFGKDISGKTVDYGSVVDEGTVLAQIDDSLYAADVAAGPGPGAVGQGRPSCARQADLGQMKAKLDQAQRDWERAQKLGPSEALAQSSYDAYKSAYETAKANVAVDEAAIVQAKADRGADPGRPAAGPAEPGLLHDQSRRSRASSSTAA